MGFCVILEMLSRRWVSIDLNPPCFLVYRVIYMKEQFCKLYRLFVSVVISQCRYFLNIFRFKYDYQFFHVFPKGWNDDLCHFEGNFNRTAYKGEGKKQYEGKLMHNWSRLYWIINCQCDMFSITKNDFELNFIKTSFMLIN